MINYTKFIINIYLEIMHHGQDDSSMGRRAYLTLGLTAAASAVGVGPPQSWHVRTQRRAGK
ncbi:hypothetical protein HAPAU_07550 [Halalkalicoccus paucihalophilus]|uniref:Uncharacterized protein n=1 Tax=Halalkalicoccus paucihalophilus TaxID=1008153 RepID=A0A151AGS6_9EURY|nr:hypothetical protein HAPAU_07550 [Halalkalicoccus paucihalophilus]